MSRYVYTIQSNETLGDGRRRYHQIETWHPTLMSLAQDLREGPVVVEQLFTRKLDDEPGVFEIVGRRDLLLTWHFIFNAYVPDKRFVEYDARPAAEGALVG